MPEPSGVYRLGASTPQHALHQEPQRALCYLIEAISIGSDDGGPD